MIKTGYDLSFRARDFHPTFAYDKRLTFIRDQVRVHRVRSPRVI
jgi:hypothetical protein